MSGPNGVPGGMPSGGSALKRLPHCPPPLSGKSGPAKKLDPDDLRRQERDVDPVVAMPADLALAGDVATAMAAGGRVPLHDTIGVRRQQPSTPGR